MVADAELLTAGASEAASGVEQRCSAQCGQRSDRSGRGARQETHDAALESGAESIDERSCEHVWCNPLDDDSLVTTGFPGRDRQSRPGHVESVRKKS